MPNSQCHLKFQISDCTATWNFSRISLMELSLGSNREVAVQLANEIFSKNRLIMFRRNLVTSSKIFLKIVIICWKIYSFIKLSLKSSEIFENSSSEFLQSQKPSQTQKPNPEIPQISKTQSNSKIQSQKPIFSEKGLEIF